MKVGIEGFIARRGHRVRKEYALAPTLLITAMLLVIEGAIEYFKNQEMSLSRAKRCISDKGALRLYQKREVETVKDNEISDLARVDDGALLLDSRESFATGIKTA